ncbi:MAG: ABC transporter permease [Hydrogenophaga sp.]|nr:ABC transporter permease [Hydrogenophaga sp.]
MRLWAARPLLWVMVRRELQARVAGSALGLIWVYLQPLLTVAVYFLVFDLVFAMKLGANAPSERVGTYLVVGALPWLAFAEGLTRGAGSLVEAGHLLQKNPLPPGLFVLRSVGAGLVVFAPVLFLVTLLYGYLNGIGWALLALPVLFVVQGVMTALLAWILAIFTAAARDTLQLLTFALQLGIFLSPVLFVITMFPEAWRWVLYLNPMTPLVMGYQSVLLSLQWPDWTTWVGSGVWVALLATCLSLFVRNSRDQLVDWL